MNDQYETSVNTLDVITHQVTAELHSISVFISMGNACNTVMDNMITLNCHTYLHNMSSREFLPPSTGIQSFLMSSVVGDKTYTPLYL